MALAVQGHYVLKIQVADDSQGRKTRSHSIGILETAADTWTEIQDDVSVYLTALAPMIDGVVIGWSLSRRAVWTGDINAPSTSDNERKAVIPIVDAAGRKGTLELPSLDETLLLGSGIGEGLYLDPDNADVIAYLAALTNGTYLFPRDGVAIDTATAGKKMHVASGVLRERVG